MSEIKRCKWCNLKNPIYIKYHDEEWGVPNFDEQYLFEMLILESFQAGLSWECVLNKREAFRKAFDGFNAEKIAVYDDNKIAELQNNKDIIRNKLKIRAALNNAKIFLEIQKEYGVSSSALSNWVRKYSQVQVDDDTLLTAQQVKALQRRNAELEEENLILKKAIAIFTPHSDRD